MEQELLRSIPQVEVLLNDPKIVEYQKVFQRQYLKVLVQNFLEYIRGLIKDESQSEELKKDITENIIVALEEYLSMFAEDNYKRVINATGVILHTNLGRSPLCKSAIHKISEIGRYYVNLEYDLEEGTRGDRDEPIQELFQLLLEAPSTLIVNNNAAAVLLVLNTFAEGKEVIISRGELIEIGASFRLPEIMSKSGAILREVGTTNKTKLSDYEKAFSEKTEVILRVHPSNYRIVGFTERPPLEELINLAKKNGYYIFKDLGSGNISSLGEQGFSAEPNAKEIIEKGVDLVFFSGDKILGGPQCGIICGKENLIAKIKSNPLYRAMRVDKLTLVALEATLRCYLRGEQFTEIIPLRMLTSWKAELEMRAKKFVRKLRKKIDEKRWDSIIRVDIVDSYSYLGGGFAPTKEIPSCGIIISCGVLKTTELCNILRMYKIPIIARIEKDSILMDFRSIQEEEDEIILQAIMDIMNSIETQLKEKNGIEEEKVKKETSTESLPPPQEAGDKQEQETKQ